MKRLDNCSFGRKTNIRARVHSCRTRVYSGHEVFTKVLSSTLPKAGAQLQGLERSALKLLFLLAFVPLALAQFHRAEQDREISYWLLDPATHQFHISHDFTVTRPGQASVHSFVRKGSVVSPDAKMIDLDTGKELHTHTVSGKDVNALGYYPTPTDP